MGESKKYIVSYQCASTGYGWEAAHDRLEEFEGFIDEKRHDYTTRLTVWDNQLKEFIFWKWALSPEPEIDMLSDTFRDMRTKTRRKNFTR